LSLTLRTRDINFRDNVNISVEREYINHKEHGLHQKRTKVKQGVSINYKKTMKNLCYTENNFLKGVKQRVK
jgi:hypothetical protein